MVAVTAAVWVRLYVVRIDEFRRRGIPPQSVATSKQLGEVLQEFRAADNFRNLFEAPVLFYALCLAIGQTGVRSGFFEAGCWTYVLLRALHSLIHCTYN